MPDRKPRPLTPDTNAIFSPDMATNPYKDLPRRAFWKSGVAQENPHCIEGIYKRKFTIAQEAKIATAGSCFAQHISRHLSKNGYRVLDVEPAPSGLPEHWHAKYGYSMYSARYGNIYTTRQLLQLAQEASGLWKPQNHIWEKEGRFFDALRPAVEPEGLASAQEVIAHRQEHLSQVKRLFKKLDLFVFTLGLTEMWVHKESGTVYPSAPGTIAGEYDPNKYQFINAGFSEIIDDFQAFQQVLSSLREGRPFQILLTVSPVPLTATASNKHVLVSTVYSKSTLRAVAGHLESSHAHIDYFPSFEIVTNPRLHSTSFEENLRSVRPEAVTTVMRHFFAEHPVMTEQKDKTGSKKKAKRSSSDGNVQCEDALLEAFGQ